MHPILLRLAPEHCAVLGALVAIMMLASNWPQLKERLRSTGARAVGIVIALGVASAIGYVVGQHFEKPPAIHTFGPLVALGSFVAILYIRHEGARRGFDPEVLTGLAVEVLLVGVAGSRVLFILITPEAFPHHPEDSALHSYLIQYLALWNGGLVWYGGLLPAAIFALWRGRKLGLPWRTVADIFAPAVMFGLAVGRIGCLMAGDDHGMPVKGLTPNDPVPWWALQFTHPEALVLDAYRPSPEWPHGVPLWPAQPLMAIGAFTIAMICHLSRKKLQDRPSSVMLLMMTLYPIHRFFIEMIRGDVVRKFLYAWQYTTDPRTGETVASAGLSTSQAISIPLVLLCAGFLVRNLLTKPRGIEHPAPQSALKKPEEQQPVAAAVVSEPSKEQPPS